MNYLGMIGGHQILLLLALPILIITLIALIDVLKSKFKGNDKLIWIVLILFLTIFGALLYFIIGKGQKIK